MVVNGQLPGIWNSAQPIGAGLMAGQYFNAQPTMVGNSAQSWGFKHVSGQQSKAYLNEYVPFNVASVNSTVPLPHSDPILPIQHPTKSFAAAMAGTDSLPNLRPNSVFTSKPSPYPNHALGQLAGDVTTGGFIRAYAMAVGEFGLVPRFPIIPLKSIVDGNQFLSSRIMMWPLLKRALDLTLLLSFGLFVFCLRWCMLTSRRAGASWEGL